MSILDDAELLGRTRSDAGAFGIFYRRHGEAVLAFHARRSGNAEAAADLTAETFATALMQAERFDPARGEPVAWLFGIARHKLADYHRSGAVERRAQRKLGMQRIALDDEEIERVERLASLDVSAEALHGALDTLPADQRAAVTERIVRERSFHEIAAAAAITPVAARQRVTRGLSALRDRLGGPR